MNFKQHLKKYAEHELELIGFMQSNLGPACLEFLDKCATAANDDANVIKKICEWLPRLAAKLPISPITEDDFENEAHGVGDESVSMMRCTRYQYVYRTSDGKYWDDRAVAFRNEDSAETDLMFLYGENGSKREITLPYYPETIIQTLPKNN